MKIEIDLGDSVTEVSDSFKESLRSYAVCGLMNMKIKDSVVDDQELRDIKMCGVEMIMNQMKMQSIYFVMDQFSPEMRKEIMDHAIEDRFSEGASTNRYLEDWYTTDGERKPN